MLAFVGSAKAITWNVIIVVNTTGPHKTQIVSGIAFVGAAFIDVLMLSGHQRGDGQQIGCCLPRTQDHITNAANEWLNDILDAMQFLLWWKTYGTRFKSVHLQACVRVWVSVTYTPHSRCWAKKRSRLSRFCVWFVVVNALVFVVSHGDLQSFGHFDPWLFCI